MTSPAWIRRLLRLLAAADRVDDVIGDFEEIHRRRIRDGRPLPGWRSGAEGLTLVGAMLVCRFSDSERVVPGFSTAEWRLALRRARQQPVMSLVTVFALAVGIALAATAFAALETALWSQLPLPGGERFVRFGIHHERSLGAQLDLRRYHALLAEGEAFEHVGAAGMDVVNLRHPSGSIEPLEVNLLTPSSFGHLPYVPLLGRPLLPADGEAGAPPVVLLHESLWRRRFDADPTILGRSLDMGGTTYEVVGVMPQEAAFPAGGEAWLPLDTRHLGGNAEGPHPRAQVFAILAEGVTLERAQSKVDVLSAQVAEALSEASEVRVRVSPYTAMPPGAVPGFALMVTALSALLLVVAANIANLNLVRIAARSRELVVRSALGASRALLIGQIVLEMAVLGGLAAVLGWTAATRALAFFDQALVERPFWIDFSAGPRTLAFVGLLTFGVSVVGGLVPALRATRGEATAGLRSGVRDDFSFGRLGASMTVVEMALSVALICGALVMAKGLSGYDHQVLPVPEDRLLTARVIAPSPMPGEEPDWNRLTGELAHTLQLAPGILAHGITSSLPRTTAPARPVLVLPEAATGPESEDGGPAQAARPTPVVRVGPGFLESIGAGATAGRLFRETDFEPEAPPVAVVNQPFVERFFSGHTALGGRSALGGRTVLGRRLAIPDDDGQGEQTWRIVGVVPDLGLSVADPERAAGFYVPMREVDQAFYLVARTASEPSAATPALRRAVAEVDPRIRVLQTIPLLQVGEDERDFFKGFGSSLVAMGCLALLLSLVGLYAMTSLTLGRRTREIGIRLALGARGREILALVLGRSARYLALGGALGAVFAFAFMAFQDRLFVVRLPAQETWIIPAVVGLLALAGLAATWVPARRALAVAPSEALRED